MAMTPSPECALRSYQVRRIENPEASGLLRSVLSALWGHDAPSANDDRYQTPQCSDTFVARAGRRTAGSMTLDRAHGKGAARTVALRRLEIDPEFLERGCVETLLDLAMQWAASHECTDVIIELPSADHPLVARCCAQGFHWVREQRSGSREGTGLLLSKTVAGTVPRSDLWFSPHRGVWFASMPDR